MEFRGLKTPATGSDRSAIRARWRAGSLLARRM